MKISQRTSLLAAGVALAAGLVPVAARADAVAQSILNVTNFHFAAGNGAAGRAANGSLLGNITVITATTTADSSAFLNGVTDNGSLYNTLGQQAKVGNFGTYVPFAQLLGAPVATYSAATSDQAGNALTGTATANTDSVVSLAPSGDGSTQGNVNLNAKFSFNVNTANTKIEIAFDANSFLRAMLDQVGFGASTATSSYSWVMTIVNNTGAQVFKWSPDGTVGSGITGGTEYADAFSLVDSRSVLGVDDFSLTNTTGSFEAETNGLAIGTYTVSVRQTTNADAFLRIPEPGSLALMGIALLGAAGVGRRRSMKK